MKTEEDSKTQEPSHGQAASLPERRGQSLYWRMKALEMSWRSTQYFTLSDSFETEDPEKRGLMLEKASVFDVCASNLAANLKGLPPESGVKRSGSGNGRAEPQRKEP